MRVLVACGGTSGHINPAIAIAGELRRRHKDAGFLFIGTEEHLEADLVPRAGFDITHIHVTGLSRKKNFSALKHNLAALSHFREAQKQTARIIRGFRPDIVIGTGGYVSAPVLTQAVRMKIKTVIHEQNAFAGMTTKMLAPKADLVFLSFPLAHPIRCRKDRCFVVGNPVREEFRNINRKEARQKLGIPENIPLVLSYGGSLGAAKINEAMCAFARKAAEENVLVLYHGAARDYDQVCATLSDLAGHPRIRIFQYIYNMPQVMAASDLVISRSGAMSLSEIAVLAKPSVLIPSPNVTENHQYFNAKAYSDAGAAILVPEAELEGNALYDTVRDLVFDRGRLTQMARAAGNLSHPEAVGQICDKIEALLLR